MTFSWLVHAEDDASLRALDRCSYGFAVLLREAAVMRCRLEFRAELSVELQNSSARVSQLTRAVGGGTRG